MSDNRFENGYIIQALMHFSEELKTEIPAARTIDKYAVQLTAYMEGQIKERTRKEWESRCGMSS
jgi:hypothetical protein